MEHVVAETMLVQLFEEAPHLPSFVRLLRLGDATRYGIGLPFPKVPGSYESTATIHTKERMMVVAGDNQPKLTNKGCRLPGSYRRISLDAYLFVRRFPSKNGRPTKCSVHTYCADEQELWDQYPLGPSPWIHATAQIPRRSSPSCWLPWEPQHNGIDRQAVDSNMDVLSSRTNVGFVHTP